MSHHGLETLEYADTETRSQHVIDDKDTGPSDPFTWEKARCSSTKMITEMARLLRGWDRTNLQCCIELDVTIANTYIWCRLWPDHVNDYDSIDGTVHLG